MKISLKELLRLYHSVEGKREESLFTIAKGEKAQDHDQLLSISSRIEDLAESLGVEVFLPKRLLLAIKRFEEKHNVKI